MFPEIENEDDAPAVVGDFVVTGEGLITAPPSAPEVAPVIPSVNITPEGTTDDKPLTLQQINTLVFGHSHRLSTLTSTLQVLSKVVETKLREAFEAGEDVTKYVNVALISSAPDSGSGETTAPTTEAPVVKPAKKAAPKK